MVFVLAFAVFAFIGRWCVAVGNICGMVRMIIKYWEAFADHFFNASKKGMLGCKQHPIGRVLMKDIYKGGHGLLVDVHLRNHLQIIRMIQAAFLFGLLHVLGSPHHDDAPSITRFPYGVQEVAPEELFLKEYG